MRLREEALFANVCLPGQAWAGEISLQIFRMTTNFDWCKLAHPATSSSSPKIFIAVGERGEIMGCGAASGGDEALPPCLSEWDKKPTPTFSLVESKIKLGGKCCVST